MTKSKSSASSTAVPSIFVIYFVNGAKRLNFTLVKACPIAVILPLTKMEASLYTQRLGFNTSV